MIRLLAVCLVFFDGSLAVAGSDLYDDKLYTDVIGSNSHVNDIVAGSHFTETTNSKNFDLLAVEHNGINLWVAVGAADGSDAYIITSPDGITWTERANPKNAALYALGYNGSDLWVAAGASDGADVYVVTSPDGITWTERTCGETTTARDVCYSPTLGLWIMVGSHDGAGQPIIRTSPDGTTWTKRSMSGSATRDLYSVTCKNTSTLVAVGPDYGGDAFIATSTDGVTWTERANAKANDFYAVEYVDTLSKWIAAGEAEATNIYIWSSTDGTTWGYEYVSDRNSTIYGINHDNGITHLIGTGAAYDDTIFYSPGSTEWVTVEAQGLATTHLRAIDYDSVLKNWVIVGDDNSEGSDAYILRSMYANTSSFLTP